MPQNKTRVGPENPPPTERLPGGRAEERCPCCLNIRKRPDGVGGCYRSCKLARILAEEAEKRKAQEMRREARREMEHNRRFPSARPSNAGGAPLPSTNGAIQVLDAAGNPIDEDFDESQLSTRFSVERATDANGDPQYLLPCSGPCIKCRDAFRICLADSDERLPVLKVRCKRHDRQEGFFYKLFIYTGDTHMPLICGVSLFIDGLLNPYQIYHEHATTHPVTRPDYKEHNLVALIDPKKVRHFQAVARRVLLPVVYGPNGPMFDPDYSSEQWVDEALEAGLEAGVLSAFPAEPPPSEEEQSQVELTEQQPIRRRGLEKILGSMMRLMAGRGL